MSAEGFYPRREEGKKLIISRKAIQQAFPPGKDRGDIGGFRLREAVEMSEQNPHLLAHLSPDKLSEYPKNSNVEVHAFSDGARFMHRILRHNTDSVPVLSEDLLSVYDMDNQRAIEDGKKGMKDYFADKWLQEYDAKPEHAELAAKIRKVGEIWTPRIEEVWGGAYYVASAYEKHEHVQKANKDLQPEIQELKRKVPGFFRNYKEQ
jgi:hypothetical protein